MPKRLLATTVFDAAFERILSLYQVGHRVVVSFSGGKDSGVLTELCIMAAHAANRLPVEVVMRDEEIMYPGTFEYAERIAARPEVRFHWMIANHPVLNYFARGAPYWWTFDLLLESDQWVRRPPDFAYTIPELHIQGMVTKERFPPDPGKELICMVGLRSSESRARALGLQASGHFIMKENAWGCRNARPLYDWKDGDIWKSIYDYKWDYNSAYDVMHRKGIPRSQLRIAPPTMALAGIKALSKAAEAWPHWFDKVCTRLPGIRSAALFGKSAVSPLRRVHENWEECFWRTCVKEAPTWIAARAEKIAQFEIANHACHSTQPYPQIENCTKCSPMLGSWQDLGKALYMGDPFSLKQSIVPVLDPEFFRPGSGTWGKGKPTW